jgi:hypothetical protein
MGHTWQLAVALTASLSAIVAAAPKDHWPEPENKAPHEWVVLGPFPNAEASAPNKARPGLDQDFLESLGGEPKARIDAKTSVTRDGQTFTARPAPMSADARLDFAKLFGEPSDLKVAYAYAEFDAKQAHALHARFGSDDAAAVWLNGKRVHRIETPGREANVDSDQFDLPVQAGTNWLLVKVENGTGGWALALRLNDDEGERRRKALQVRRDLDAADPGPRDKRHVLEDTFPEIVWRNADSGRAIFGDNPIKVRWFAPDLSEAPRPDKLGRYAAVLEATTVDGLTYRRMLAFAKLPPNVLPNFWRGAPDVHPPPVRLPPDRVKFASPLNEAQQTEMSRHLWNAAGRYFYEGEESAIAGAALVEMADSLSSSAASPTTNATSPRVPAYMDSGFLRTAERQLRLRMKLDGREAKPLPPPQTLTTPAAELRTASEPDAGLRPGTVERLRALCGEWLKDDPNGFVVLVARRGVIVMHEGFGDFKADSYFRPASIGKSIAGLTFARAVDEGLFTIDQKVVTSSPTGGSPRRRP